MTFLLALLLAVPAVGPPAWQAPAPGAFPQAMAVTGVVRVGGVDLRSSSDRVAAFVGGQIRGVAAPTLVGSRRVFFLSVAGRAGDGAVSFKAYDATGDRVLDLTPDLTFNADAPVGTAVTPLVWTPLVGAPPVWTVDAAAFEGSMSVTAAVRSGAAEVAEAGTLVGAFVGGQLRGSASVVPAGTAGARAFLTVYGDTGEAASVTFRVYRPGAARVFAVTETAALAVGGSAGTVAAPVALTLTPGATLAGAQGWRMLAPPGAETTVSAFLAPIWTQGFPGADTPAGAPTVYAYSEAAGAYAPVAGADVWARGTGRFAYVYADDDPRTPVVDGGFPKTLPPVGIGPSGPFTFALTRTPGTGGSLGPGWNLLGNPFDAAADWDVGWTRTGVAASVYVWDPNHFGGSYRVWNGTTGSLPGGVIPAGNAFWAQATAAAPVLSVSEAARTSAVPLAGRPAGEPAALRLLLTSDERPGLGAEAFLSLQPDAAPGLDDADAWLLTTLTPDFVSLGFVAEGGLLTIDARPAAPGMVSIPLGVAAVAGSADRSEALRLSWPDLSPGFGAVLVDAETGVETDLRDVPDYAFTLSAPAVPRAPGAPLDLPVHLLQTGGEPRLSLRLMPGVATQVEAEPALALRLDAPTPNPARGAASVAFTLPRDARVRVVLVDMLGHDVAVASDGLRSAGRHTVALPVSGLAAGVYAVRLEAGGERRVRRIAVVR